MGKSGQDIRLAKSGRFDRSNLSHLWGVRGMHLEGINNNALPMAVQIDVIWRLRCRQRCWSTSASVLPCYSISSLKHLWLPHKGSKSKIEISPSPGKSLKPPRIFPTNCTFVTPAHFTKFMGPHQICFMSLESNPKGREVKKIIGQLVFSFQGGLGVPRAQRELQLDSQFAAAEKANKLI